MSREIVESTAAAKAGVRLIDADHSIRAAFDELGLGWTFDDVVEYAAPTVRRMLARPDPGASLVGIIAAAMMIAVERERERE